MTFVLAFSGLWLLLLAGICAKVFKGRREKGSVTAQWLHDNRYERGGDVPPGTPPGTQR